MRKIICLTIAIALVLGSFSFIFASATSWDTTDQSNLQSIKNTLTNTTGSTIYYMISQINAAMRFSNKTLANWLSDIYNSLNNNLLINDSDVGRQSVTYWVREAVLDLDTLVGTGSGTLIYNVTQLLTNSNTIKQGVQSISNTISTISQSITQIETDVAGILITANQTLPGIYAYAGNIDVSTDAINTTTATYLPLLDPLRQALTNYKSGDAWNDVTATSVRSFAHRQLITNLATGEYDWMNINQNGTTGSSTRKWGLGTPLGNIALMLDHLNRNFVYGYSAENANFNSQQSATSWLTLNASNFTPVSAIDGIYKWFSNLQTPIARLAYVHASDEEIEARELAADNQAEVVDDFIDPNGAGSVSASSFGSVSDLSSGMTSNLSTDASPTGILDIFNSSHGSWFSQETKNQLDTTANTRKGSETATPLLDQQIEEIYSLIGADNHD